MDSQTTTNFQTYRNDIFQDCFQQETPEENYLFISESDFNKLVPTLPDNDIVLISLFCVEDFNAIPGFTLFYAFEKRGCRNIVFLLRYVQHKESTSIAEIMPSACWFEREIRDGFGIEFKGAFDQRRLFLHEAYPRDFHPLLKSFQNRDLGLERGSIAYDEKYKFKTVHGEGVYQIPVGPVHAGIIEPGHFRFNVVGETILNLEIRMFYKHRGIEKLAENKRPAQCVAIAESISGDETAANAIAFCMAVENISNITIPEKAWFLRTIILELERIYSHLGDIAGMIVDVAFPVGAVEFQILREEILRLNSLLTGSRFMKGIICPGGLCRDIPVDSLQSLSAYLTGMGPRLEAAVSFIHRSTTVIDRLETTGIIERSLINPLNVTGPAARASGIAIDNRIDHPYGIYPLIEVIKRTADKGDVLSRFNIKADEITDSIGIIQRLITEIKDGEFVTSVPVKDGCSFAIIEAARGQNCHWVYIRNGIIDRYKVRTASFCNWQAIEHAVTRDIVPDFPLINKSLNLSYAGTDL